MAERLTRDVALALLGNTIATGAILVVLITILGPISGAHFNPAVSLMFALKRELSSRACALYVAAQIAGGVIGAMLAHAMFGLPLLEASLKVRSGGAQWLAEAVASFGLIATPAMALQAAADTVIQGRLTALGGDGGVVALAPDGQVAWSFNTTGMYRARAAEGQTPVVSINQAEPWRPPTARTRDTATGAMARPRRTGPPAAGAGARGMANIGRWPWPREVHAELIDQLSAAKAKTVAHTAFFFEPQTDRGLTRLRELR
eukprot:gene15584-20648_t